MVFKRDRLRRFFRLSFMVGAFFLLVISGRALAAAEPLSPTAADSGGTIPLEVQRQNEANDQCNINNTTSLGCTVGNNKVLLVPDGGGQPTQAGGTGVADSFAGWLQNALDPGPPRKTTVLGADGKQHSYYVYSPGAISTTIGLTAQLYEHPPASSVEYIADLIDNAKHPFVPKAYAQGLGFSSLAPVLELWKLFRNVAYFFFVIIFLIVGFLIMIRARIGSQAAVTVQQILPQLVISLILVTFSYAIAGLLLDVMNILIFLLIGVFTSVFPGGVIQDVTLNDIAFRNDIFSNGIGLITKGVAGSIAGSMGQIVQSILVNLGWSQWVTDVLKLGTNVIFTLILTIVIILSLFRVFFALLTAYVGIFFSVIFAPIQLMLGALPGQNAFQKWIRGLMENLLVFPTIILMIFIAYFFAKPLATTSGGFSAPQLGSNQGPQGFAVYQSLIALGVILAMPEVLKVTKGIMKGEVGVNIGDLTGSLKQGVPLGTRLGLAGGAALGAGGLAFGRDLISSRGRDLTGAFERAKVAAVGGTNPLTGKKELGAAARGVQLSSAISRGVGANQPDILNPVTGFIDRRLNPEVKAREERLQEFEDMVDRLRGSQPTRGTSAGGGQNPKP